MGKVEIGLIFSVIGLIFTFIKFHSDSKNKAELQEKRITKLEDIAENNRVTISELKSNIKNLEKYSEVVIRLDTLMDEFGKRLNDMSKKIDKILEKR